MPSAEQPTRVAEIGYKPDKYAKKPSGGKRSSVSLNPNGIYPMNDRSNSVSSVKQIFIRSASEFSSEKSLLNKDGASKRGNWFLRKDCGSCGNFVWLTIGCALFIAVCAIFGLLILKIIRQQDANVNAPTGQSGFFVGEACNNSRECSSHAICISGTCQCVSEMYYDHNFGKCMFLKSNAQSCLETRECNQYFGLLCINSFCSCPQQTIWANYFGRLECIRTREVGETCQTTSHCVGNSYCGLVSGTNRCTCPSNKFLNGVTGQCEFIRKVHERCFNWFQECPTLTTCRTNNNGDGNLFCLCIEGTFYNPLTQTCDNIRSINGACDANILCNTNVGLFCLNNKCVCPASTTYWNGTFCQIFSSYGRPCSSTQLCITTDSNLLCGIPPYGISQTMCYCRDNYFFDEYNQRCTLLLSEGAVCYESSECVDNAFCIGNICACVPGYWSNPTNGACEPYLSFGDFCSSAATAKPCNNLINGINCFAGTCSCDPTYEFWDSSFGYCQDRRHYLEACSTVNLCASYRGFTCTSSLCQCTAGLSYFSSSDWCR